MVMSRKAAVELERKRKVQVQKVKDSIAQIVELTDNAGVPEPVLEDAESPAAKYFTKKQRTAPFAVEFHHDEEAQHMRFTFIFRGNSQRD